MFLLKHMFQARYVIMVIIVNYIPRFNLYTSNNVFKRFLRQKNVQRVLVLNLFEISKEFFIFIDLKITELTRLTNYSEPFVTFE